MQELSRNDPNFTDKLIFSDEAHFHLSGFLNKQNCRIGGSENPRSIHQRELHSIKCTLWCGVTKDENIGPYFFGESYGKGRTV